MIIGYARVSTDDQNLDAQTDALTAAGAGKLFADKISGSKRKRPELDRMLDQLRDGDVVTVTKYDRCQIAQRQIGKSPDKRGVPLPVKMVSQLTQTWHSQVRSFC